MSLDPVITVRNLEKTFYVGRGSSVKALDKVSCELMPGTCLVVVGESGSGKSTLARIIVGLDSAESGTVHVAGSEVKQTRIRKTLRDRAREVQMVFQDPEGSLNRSLPVIATIDEMLRAHRPELPAERRKRRALQLFEEVGLTERHAKARPSALSGGQKQRVAIARALAADPKILVLDEAVSALDVSVQAQVLDLLRRLRDDHGLSYLFITHDLSVAREVADRVMVMKSGQVIESGSVDEILDHPADPYTKLLIASAPRPGWQPIRGLRQKLLGATEA